jgi:hypothetical protein
VNADFLAILFEQPYARIANVMARCAISRPAATAWLNELVDGGILLKLSVSQPSFEFVLPQPPDAFIALSEDETCPLTSCASGTPTISTRATGTTSWRCAA